MGLDCRINPSSFMKAVRDYAHSFFRRVVFRLCFHSLVNTKESSQKVLMDTNHWFSTKKPLNEVKGKLFPGRLIKEFSVSLDTTTPKNRELERKKTAITLSLTHSCIKYYSKGKEK